MQEYRFNLLKQRMSIEQIKTYLTVKGWKHNSNYPYRNLLIFEPPSFQEGLETVVLPSSMKFKDFDNRFFELLEELSLIENRDTEEILYNIINPETDRLKIRLQSESTINGSIPLEYAKQCIEAIKELIISSINNEIEPRPHYRRPRKHVLDIARKYCLGQSEFGGYTFVVEAPVFITEEEVSLRDTQNALQDTISRRVFKRIISGIQEVESKYIFYDPEQYLKGLNSNMCEALIKLNDTTKQQETSIECSINWASQFPILDNKTYSTKLSPSTFVKLIRVSKLLRDHQEYNVYKNTALEAGDTVRLTPSKIDEGNPTTQVLKEFITFSGRVIEVRTDHRSPYFIVIEVKDERILIGAALDLQNFITACVALKSGAPIKVTGTLKQEGNQYLLSNLSDFKIEN